MEANSRVEPSAQKSGIAVPVTAVYHLGKETYGLPAFGGLVTHPSPVLKLDDRGAVGADCQNAVVALPGRQREKMDGLLQFLLSLSVTYTSSPPRLSSRSRPQK